MTLWCSSGCSWPPSPSWRGSAPCSPTKATMPSIIAISAGSSAPNPASTSAASHTDQDWASGAGRSSAAMPGSSRTSVSLCATTASASSSSHCSKLHASSWLQDAWPRNCENRLLVVRPLNQCEIWEGGHAEAARRAMAAPSPPDEGMLVLVPVGGGLLDRLLDLGPGLEAAAVQGQ